MSNKTELAKKNHTEFAELSVKQQTYLLEQYGSLEKALKVFIEAKDSGLLSFELLEN